MSDDGIVRRRDARGGAWRRIRLLPVGLAAAIECQQFLCCKESAVWPASAVDSGLKLRVVERSIIERFSTNRIHEAFVKYSTGSHPRLRRMRNDLCCYNQIPPRDIQRPSLFARVVVYINGVIGRFVEIDLEGSIGW